MQSRYEPPEQIGRPLSIAARPVCDDREYWPGDDRPWCGRKDKACDGCEERRTDA